MSIQTAWRVAALAASVVAVHTAAGATILPGLYRLNNHPDGSQNPPPYGARFDELFNATSNHDVFTLDFDDVNSAAFMTINATFTEIRIYGQAKGGRDIGATHAADIYNGIYTFDFTYNLGVQAVPGDDDVWVVTPDHRNFGFITAPNALGTINLTDEGMDGYTFRLGDENNDAGHRGFPGISGWGWMSYVRDNGSIVHINYTDWLFTATYIIPSPSSAGLLGLAALAAGRRRRK
jgi:uncharacterized protein (TIGR03382 family)